MQSLRPTKKAHHLPKSTCKARELCNLQKAKDKVQRPGLWQLMGPVYVPWCSACPAVCCLHAPPGTHDTDS